MEISDREYVIRTLEGDKEAYGALIDAYKGMVFGVALNITGNYSDSEDIVQEAFLRAYEKLRTLSDPSKFAKWLYGLTRNLALQVLRQKRNITVHAAEYVSREQADSYSESPAEAYARKELSALLWNQVAELPPKTREAILLYYMEGFSIKRAAAFIGISEGAMKMRLKFGREKLRESIMEKIEGELRQRQPSRKTRDAILAALPTGAVPPTGIIESIAPKLHLPLMALSAKKIVIITGVVLLGLIGVLTLRNYQSRPPSSQPPPLIMEQEDVGDVAELGEIKESKRQQINGTQIPETDLVTHSINGRVLEKGSDYPIPGVMVVLNREGKAVKNSVTDQQGAFSLSDLADGRYELALQAADESVKGKYYLPRDGGKVRINLSGQDVDNLTLTFSRTTHISGQVVDQDGKPITGATLRLKFRTGIRSFPDTQSDANGKFSFLGLYPNTDYTLLCEVPGFTKARAEVRPEIDRPIDDLIIQLFRGKVSISGRVMNQKGEPVEHVLVEARSYSMGTMGAFEHYFALTDDQGAFSFHNVPPGEVTIATALDKSFSVKLNAKPSDRIENVEIVVNWEQHQGYIAGTVIDESNQPVTQGFLYAYHKEAWPEIGVTIPNELGEFRIENLQVGKPVNIFYARGFLYRRGWGSRKPGAENILPSAENVIVLVRREEPIESLFLKGVCTVRGRVLDKETNQPIEQFAIAVSYKGCNRSQREDFISFFAPQGQFEIENVKYYSVRDNAAMEAYYGEIGTFLYVEAEGYQGKWEEVILGKGMKQAFTDILLERGLSLQGRVVNLENEPLEGAMLFIARKKENHDFTDANGEFRLSNLELTSCAVLHVSHPAYIPFISKPFDLRKDVEDYSVQLSKGGTILGGVVDQQGNSVVGAVISIATPHGDLSARTGTKGVYMAEHVPPGKCNVRLKRPISRVKVAWVEEGKETVVNFGVSDSTLYGTVFLDDKPLASAEVIIVKKASFLNRTGAQTDSNGRYLISCISAGQYSILVNHDDKDLIVLPIDIPEDAKIQKDIVIRPGSICGYVVQGEDRSPVKGARVALYPPENVLRRSFPNMFMLGRGMRRMETNAEGHFEFDRVAAGEYLVEAESKKLGETFANVSVEHARVHNIVLAFEPTGSIRLTAVDADTGEGLSIKGDLLLRDIEGWITHRWFSTPTPVTVDSINAGVYAVALLSNSQGPQYISRFKKGISVEPGKVTPVTLKMRQAVEFTINIIDAQHKPVGGFECFFDDPEGSPVQIIGVAECSIIGISPIGDVRLVLTKNGKTIYDDYVQVTAPDGERTFQTRIVVE